MIRPLLATCLLAPTAFAADHLETVLSRRLLADRQTMIEAQIHLGSSVASMPLTASRQAWETEATALRKKVLDEVVFRGAAAEWRRLPSKAEWLDVLPGEGYRIRKFRYQIVPGMWLPGFLYEPAKMEGRIPVVINVNGHEKEGVSTGYIQERCVHLARNGVLALNFEWYGKGQMSAPDYEHQRLNQIDLTGSSGLATFFLAHQRLVDIALQHPNADPQRLAVTGLSGGGWQTIVLSSLDTRVKLAVPVAGYSSFVTRSQFDKDLGDSEQTPVDLGRYADYTHLTALLAPRPSLLMNNAYDNCCFRADYAISPLIVAARPYFALYGQADRLRYYANFDPGHNYGLDNRQALYRFLNEFFFVSGKKIPEKESTPANAIRKADELRVALPAENLTFNSLALRLAKDLPRPTAAAAPEARRNRLREIVRWPEYRVDARPETTTDVQGVKVTPVRLRISGIWTVPAVEFAPAGATVSTILLGDAGRAKLAPQVHSLISKKQRVLALDPFYFGESRIELKDWLYALLMSTIGERPVGVQAAQLAAAAKWLAGRGAPVTVEAHGPRTSLIALVAAAAQPESIAGLRLFHPMKTLKEPIERNLMFSAAPEQFCFGLLEWFDVPQLTALVKPRPVETDPK